MNRLSDADLVEKWRDGDEEAAGELYERYLQKLLNLVGKHLARRFNPRLDPDDVVQSVFRSMFRLAQDGKFEFQDDDDFWKLLLTMALNKVRNKVRHHQAAKRDPSRETGDAASGNVDAYIVERLTHHPTPVETVMFTDLLEAILQRLEPREQRLIQLRLEGLSQKEIADDLQVDRRTVRRMYGRIRDKVAQLAGDDIPLPQTAVDDDE